MLSQKTNNLFFLFKLGGESFAIAIDSILEIIDESKTVFTKHSLQYFLGYHPYDGNKIPLINISFKLNPLTLISEHPKKIVITNLALQNSTLKVGFLIDYALEIINIEPYKLEHNHRQNSGFILGTIEVEDHFITLIDIHKLLHIEELIALKNSAYEHAIS